MPTYEAVNLIHRYNGIASLAHPWFEYTFKLISRLTANPQAVMEHFAEIGVDGMECFPPQHHQNESSPMFYQFAKEHQLLVTSGSDYHGTIKFFVLAIGTKEPEVLPGDNIYREEEWERVLKVFQSKNII